MLNSLSLLWSVIFLWFLYFAYSGARKIEQLKFLLNGRQMIREKARSVEKSPFSLPIFGYGGRMHIVSSEKHWDEIKYAHVGHLSLHRYVKHMFQPKYSLLDEWPDNREDGGMPIIRALRTMSNHLNESRPKLLKIFQTYLDSKLLNCPQNHDYSRVPLLETVEHLIIRVNTLFLLGEDVVDDSEMIRRGIAYSKEVSMIGEIVQIVPECLASLVTRLIKKRNKNQKYVLAKMVSLVNKRREQRNGALHNSLPKPASVLEAFVDNNPDDLSAREIIHHLNIMWTTTTLSLGIVATQFIQDLVQYKVYAPALIQDIKDSPVSSLKSRGAQTPLLESFLMESMRIHCFQSTAAHRTALKPFAFSGGYTIPAGESVQFYQEKTHFDENRYHEPKIFNPCRYCDSGRVATDVSKEWPFWGVGKNACPGRFHFSYMVKILAEYLLTQFDCELEASYRMNFTWGENSVPSSSTVLLMRRKITTDV